MRQDTKEIIAGIALFVISAVFFSYVFTMDQGIDDKYSLSKYYNINANFQNVDGIKIGGEVRIAGVHIGNITGISLSDKFKSVVNMRILKEVNLPSDSAIIIESDSLLGDKYIEILPGAEEDMITNNGYLYYTQDTIKFSKIMERIVEYTKIKQKEFKECMLKNGDNS